MTTAQLVAHLLDADRAAHDIEDAQPVTRTAEPMLTAEQCAATDDMAGLS